MDQAFILVFQLSLDDFQLQPPVTFRLKSGSGPVRITGRHQIGEKGWPFSQASLPLHSDLSQPPLPVYAESQVVALVLRVSPHSVL